MSTAPPAVAEAVLLTRVRRLVHVSSASVYGFDRRRIDEHCPKVGADHPVGYVASKAAAEEAVQDAIARGVDAVILNPGHILGALGSSQLGRAASPGGRWPPARPSRPAAVVLPAPLRSPMPWSPPPIAR